MRLQRVVAAALAASFIGMPTAFADGRQLITVSGTARKEAKRPYTAYYVRARQVSDGSIGMAVPLDASANFVLADMQAGQYLLELLDPKGKVVCTEGPLTFVKTTTKVQIRCGRDREPLFLLLAAAAAAGVSAGIAVAGPASPSR
jgi:hypothetical protein